MKTPTLYIPVSYRSSSAAYSSPRSAPSFAGNGGFNITVGNHTQLEGAVVASTAPAAKNNLDTGTLGFSDIRNTADFKTEHSGASISGGYTSGENARKDPDALLAAKEKLISGGNLTPSEAEIAGQAYNTAMASYGPAVIYSAVFRPLPPLFRGWPGAMLPVHWQAHLHLSWLVSSVITWGLMITTQPKPLLMLF